MRQQVSWLIVVVSCLASHAQAEDVECIYERRVEDYTSDPNDAYDNECGVCTTVAGSGRRLQDGTDQTQTLYITEQEDYEQFMPGDKLFLEVDAMDEDEGPLSQADLPDQLGHAQPCWKQSWHKAWKQAAARLSDNGGWKTWKDKSWKDKPWKVAMKDTITGFADSYPVKVKKVKHVVPSDDTRRLRELQAADPKRRQRQLQAADAFPPKDLISIRPTYTDLGGPDYCDYDCVYQSMWGTPVHTTNTYQPSYVGYSGNLSRFLHESSFGRLRW